MKPICRSFFYDINMPILSVGESSRRINNYVKNLLYDRLKLTQINIINVDLGCWNHFFLFIIIGHWDEKNLAIFSVVATPLSFIVYLRFPYTTNPFNYSWYPAKLLSKFACAYFTYDLIICFNGSYGIAFVIHAVLSLMTYILSVSGYTYKNLRHFFYATRYLPYF